MVRGARDAVALGAEAGKTALLTSLFGVLRPGKGVLVEGLGLARAFLPVVVLCSMAGYAVYSSRGVAS